MLDEPAQDVGLRARVLLFILPRLDAVFLQVELRRAIWSALGSVRLLAGNGDASGEELPSSAS